MAGKSNGLEIKKTGLERKRQEEYLATSDVNNILRNGFFSSLLNILTERLGRGSFIASFF